MEHVHTKYTNINTTGLKLEEFITLHVRNLSAFSISPKYGVLNVFLGGLVGLEHTVCFNRFQQINNVDVPEINKSTTSLNPSLRILQEEMKDARFIASKTGA